MSQPITIMLDEKEFAELQRRATAARRPPDEVAHALLAGHLTVPPEPLPEGFLPYADWEKKVKEEWDSIMALPIEERRAMARRAASGDFLPEGMTAVQYQRELRAEWEHRLPPLPQTEDSTR